MFNSKYHKPFEFRRVIKLKLFTLFGSYFVLPNPLSVQSEWSEATDAPSVLGSSVCSVSTVSGSDTGLSTQITKTQTYSSQLIPVLQHLVSAESRVRKRAKLGETFINYSKRLFFVF